MAGETSQPTLSRVHKFVIVLRSYSHSRYCSLLLASCGPPRADRIVIGSKNFTEQLVLGEIIAQQIENKTHLPVERTLLPCRQLTSAIRQFLAAASIFIPEYTGTALTAILKLQPSSNPQEVYNQVKNEYACALQSGSRSDSSDSMTHSPSRSAAKTPAGWA